MDRVGTESVQEFVNHIEFLISHRVDEDVHRKLFVVFGEGEYQEFPEYPKELILAGTLEKCIRTFLFHLLVHLEEDFEELNKFNVVVHLMDDSTSRKVLRNIKKSTHVEALQLYLRMIQEECTNLGIV